jgi:hypothetical protein
MKKILIGLTLIGLLFGCAGLNVNTALNVATDTAFVLALKNNPDHKAPVLKAISDIKILLKGEITYDFLLSEISKRFDGDYAYYGIILRGYVETDKPVFETHLNLFDAYKKALIEKIDNLMFLAGSV